MSDGRPEPERARGGLLLSTLHCSAKKTLHYQSVFTGIVETTAEVLSRTDARLVLARPAMFDDLREGSSISVNGACLTVVGLHEKEMAFDVMGETWRRTNLGDLTPGHRVNLERAMAATGRFEGHIVQGHVEGTAMVKEWKSDGQWKQLMLELPPHLLPFVVEKGSVALDGVSLTVAGMHKQMMTIALIPHTLDITTLGARAPGDRVNVETDILAHYMLHRSHA